MFSVVILFVFLVYYSEADIQISGPVMIVRRVKSLKCSSNVNLSRYRGQMVVYHQWNQEYLGKSNSFVSNLRAIEALNSEYTVELQKFDHNSNIYSSISVYNASNGFQHVFSLTIHCSGAERKWISLVDDDYYKYQVDHISTYGGSENVKFSCLQYLHLTTNLLDIQIGWINTAGDRIFTYNQTEIIMKLGDVHNGSMLCCLYYTASAYKNGKHIQRFVKDKTLLVYQKEMLNNGGQPSGTTTENYREKISTTQFITDTTNLTGKILNTTNDTGKTTGTTNETGKNSKTTNETAQNTGTTNEMGKNTGTTNQTGKNSKTTNQTAQNTGTTNEMGKNTGTTNETEKNSETVKHRGTTNETSTYSGTKYETGQKSNTPNATDTNTGTTNGTDSSDHDPVADTNNYVIIIISSISAIMLLLLVGICAIKNRCWKKTNRPERAQLPLPQIPGTRLRPPNNEPDANTPFYLNLLFRRECEQEIQAQEEPQYEEVMYQ